MEPIKDPEYTKTSCERETKTKLEESHSLISNYNTVIIIKVAWYWHKNRHMGQWVRVKGPEINPGNTCQLIYNKIHYL